MCYTDSPAFEMNPTHCSVCNRPLVDGTSVEAGCGPVCRKKYNYEDAYPISDTQAQVIVAILRSLGDVSVMDKAIEAVLNDDSRRAVNVLNRAVAVWMKEGTNQGDVITCLAAAREMGYEVLADKVGQRIAAVAIKEADGMVILDTPYSESFVAAIKKVQGRRWNKDLKVWMVPVTSKKAAWEALKASYPGELGMGPKGIFKI